MLRSIKYQSMLAIPKGNLRGGAGLADLPAFCSCSGKSSSIASPCQLNQLSVLGKPTLNEQFIKVGLEFCFSMIFIIRALTFLIHRRLWPPLILSHRAFRCWLICKDSVGSSIPPNQFNLLLRVTVPVERYLNVAIPTIAPRSDSSTNCNISPGRTIKVYLAGC
jgi:hypothetical protein